jgi:hypothetical protein
MRTNSIPHQPEDLALQCLTLKSRDIVLAADEVDIARQLKSSYGRQLGVDLLGTRAGYNRVSKALYS